MKGLHHLHLRKRHKAKLEPFPAKSLGMRILDRIVLVVGVIGPLTALPQIFKIYILKDAVGVSTLSWALPALLDIPWIIYGLVHGERPIVITYSLWCIASTLVVIGALLYGAGSF